MRVLCLICVLLTAACSSPERPQTPPAAATPPGAQAHVPDVSLPDLSAVAGPVQAQVRARFDALGHADSTTPPADRARRYAELGHVLLAATFFDDAVLCYRHAEALEPSNAAWAYLRGHASLRQGNRDDASAAFARTLALKPDYLPARLWLGDVELDRGHPETARAAFDAALRQEPGSAAALFGAGRAALAERAYGEATQFLERALSADPAASVIHYPLAMAYRGLGQAGKAEAQLARRGTRPPDLQDPILDQATIVLDSAVSYESMGMDAIRRQDWKGAVQAFTRGLEVAPSDASLRYWLASAMIASGDTAGAVREFQAVVAAHPDYAKAHFSLGAIFDQQGQRVDALREYEAAVRFAPNMPDARLRLAAILHRDGQHARAFTQFEALVGLDPAVADGWIGGARTLLALGRREQAREWIARGRRLHTNRPEWSALAEQAR